MIEIIKKYGKWKPGDRPAVHLGFAEELVKMKVAKYLGKPQDFELVATDQGIQEVRKDKPRKKKVEEKK